MNYLIAHRGLKTKNIKENSIPAFLNALENSNYAGFECDIRETKDKTFVIHHGPLVEKYWIKRMSKNEVKKINLPLLKDVLDLSSNKIFLLEIKDPSIDIEKLKLLLKKYPDKNIYLMSFYNSVIKKLEDKERTYKLGILNYVLNSEEDYKNYDFICLLEGVYTDKLKDYFLKQNIDVFLYGIHKKETYNIKDVYLITDL